MRDPVAEPEPHDAAPDAVDGWAGALCRANLRQGRRAQALGDRRGRGRCVLAQRRQGVARLLALRAVDRSAENDRAGRQPPAAAGAVVHGPCPGRRRPRGNLERGGRRTGRGLAADPAHLPDGVGGGADAGAREAA